MTDEEIARISAKGLNMVYKLRHYADGKEGEIADIMIDASNKIEELTVVILTLSGEIIKNERKETNTIVSNE